VPLGGLSKSGEDLRAEAHNCIAERCSYGYVKANCSDYIWICKQAGLPHVCSMFQCNIFHLGQGRTCPVSGNNFGNIGGSECAPCALGGAGDEVRKRISFAPFYTKRVRFTKTGSGQTQGELKKEVRFLTGGGGATAV
jgi:hypothetical protein